MIVRSRDQGIAVLLIVLSLFAAFQIDQSVLPHDQYVATPFAVPVLIAAYRLPLRGIVGTTLLAVAVGGYSAYLDNAPTVPSIFHLLSLLIVSVLALFLSRERQESARLATNARASQQSLARAQAIARLGNWDRDLRTGHLTWSDEIYRIFGIAPENFGGTLDAFLQRVHPADRDRVARAIAEELDSGRPYSLDHRIVRPDGTVRFVHEEAAMLRDAAGQPVRVVGTVQDITGRKRAEEERERLLQQVQLERARVEAVLNSTANGIIYIDAATKAINANAAAARLFGHPFETEGGQDQYVGQLWRPDGRSVSLNELPSRAAIRGEATAPEEFVILRPNGERCPVLGSAAPVRDAEGFVVGAVVVFQDISALKDLERLREEWTSIIAHDLRQPVTVIIGYAGLLEMKAREAAAPNRDVEHILTSARRLAKMIEDLLDVSRIETRHLVLHLEPVDLPALVRAIVERAEPTTVGHSVEARVIGSVRPVLADPARIEQALDNLLSNAAKYGSPETAIIVTIQPHDTAAAEVAVSNLGPGIPPEEIPGLFSRFHRTRDAREGRAPGLGLGLYITKGIVEAHHGQIWVTSTPGKTTTFTFSLPVAPREGTF